MTYHYKEHCVGTTTIHLLDVEHGYQTYVMDKDGGESLVEDHATYGAAFVRYTELIQLVEAIERNRQWVLLNHGSVWEQRSVLGVIDFHTP